MKGNILQIIKSTDQPVCHPWRLQPSPARFFPTYTLYCVFITIVAISHVVVDERKRQGLRQPTVSSCGLAAASASCGCCAENL